MSRFAQSVLLVLSLVAGAPPLQAQEHTLGIQFSRGWRLAAWRDVAGIPFPHHSPVVDRVLEQDHNNVPLRGGIVVRDRDTRG